MDTPIEWLRYVAIVQIAFYLVATTWFLVKKPIGGHRSISEHISYNQKYFYPMAVVFTLITISLVASLWFWVGPAYQMPPAFYACASIFLLCGMGIAWFPAEEYGSKSITHHVHYASALLLILDVAFLCFILLFATPTSAAPIAHLAAQWTLVIYTWLVLLYFLYKPSHNHYVIYESVAIYAFFALIILLSLKI